MNTTDSQSAIVSLLPLILIIVAMYFLMIRPQKKKEKEVNNMRKSLTVGDEIITIGGICGKVVKTKDESFIIQVGPEKVKFEMMKWAVSSISKPAPGKARNVAADIEEDEAPKKGVKRLRKETPEEMPVQEAETVVEVAEEVPEAQVEEILEDK